MLTGLATALGPGSRGGRYADPRVGAFSVCALLWLNCLPIANWQVGTEQRSDWRRWVLDQRQFLAFTFSVSTCRIEDVEVPDLLDRDGSARVGAAGMARFVAVACRQGEGLVVAADAVEKLGLADRVLSDEVDDATGALDLAAAGDHLDAEDDAALLVEEG